MTAYMNWTDRHQGAVALAALVVCCIGLWVGA